MSTTSHRRWRSSRVSTPVRVEGALPRTAERLGHVVLFEEQRQLAEEEVSELRDRLENVVCFITGEPMWDPVIG